MTRITVLSMLLCLLLVPAGFGLALTLDDGVAGGIRAMLEEVSAPVEIEVSGCRISAFSVIPELYERRSYRPFWTNSDAIDQMIRAIGEIYLEGLDPDDYHLREILRLRSTARDGGIASDPMAAASLDLLLTDAFVRLAYHSMCGKEDPVTYHPQWNVTAKIDETDPVEFIEQRISSPSITKTIRELKISHSYYEGLKWALAEYRMLRSSGGWEPVPEGPTLKRGMADPRVEALRRRLALTDDLPEASAEPMNFDLALEQAVMRFQVRHGLKPDGVAGKNTIAAMNVTVQDRIDQIRVNLERARWALRGIDLDERYVLVDIAGFRVFYLQGNRVIWSSRAQVGQPYRDTPVLRSAIVHVEFNPAWVVPPGIFQKDILPELLKNRGYLKKKDLKVIDNRGKAVDPKTIDWHNYVNRPFPYMLRQTPGENSALGRIKIYFPNEYLVYLHDTPSKALFEEEDRTISSGCIRVERPLELAELLLDDPSRWNMRRIEEAAESGRNQKVRLPRPVTILLMYWTVEVGQDGTIYFKKDPYDRDGLVLEGLGRDEDIRPATDDMYTSHGTK